MYGRLLMLQASDPAAALRMLRRAIAVAPDPDAAALIALAEWRLQDTTAARKTIEQALAQYCVAADGLMANVAHELMQHLRAPGWIGRSPDLALIGELSIDEPSNVLDVRLDGGAAFTQLLRSSANDARRAFSFRSKHWAPTAVLDASIRGVTLLGSGVRIAKDFGFDGRCVQNGRLVAGWARLGWRPGSSMRIRVEDNLGNARNGKTSTVAATDGRLPFALDWRSSGMRGDTLRVSAQLPDGGWQPFPDSPLILERSQRLRAIQSVRRFAWPATTVRRHRRPLLSQNGRRTDVIIPVYQSREESLVCIRAVLATIDHATRAIVVDDATDDAELAATLDELAADQRITLIRNTENQGFVASVNRAMKLNVAHDVVLLNSDAQVFDDWLPRLRAAAYSAQSVGTVTPLSNDGSITSYPQPTGASIEPDEAAALHALAAATHSGMRVDIPVGVGFCLYIRRDCLEQIGEFDAAVFGKGYGEETDFCMRARRRGWSHLVAADVFVYHAGGSSFGSRRAALLDRSQRLINRRYPGYDGFIARFLKKDPLHGIRRRLDEQRLSGSDARFVLLVTLKLAGGVDRYVGERCSQLRAQGLYPLVLRPFAAGQADRCEFWTDALDVPNLSYEIPNDLPDLIALLRTLPIEAIEIQHFLHLDARVIDAVRQLDIPYDVVVHDYAWICPRVTLIDGSGRHCGEPAVSVCETCVRRHGSKLGETISVRSLRARSAQWLAGARRVTAPSHDAAARLQRHFPDLPCAVQPHTAPRVASTPPLRSGKRAVYRIALIGAIGEHKGYRYLLECAKEARARRLPLEFVVIGYTQDDAPLLKTGKVFITGRYTDGEVSHLLHREHPDAIWLPSVWPETWCYTLDYALESGLPVAAFDLGAIAQRLRNAGTGLLMSLDLNPRAINDQLLKLLTPTAVNEHHAVAASAHIPTNQPPRRDHAEGAAKDAGNIIMPPTSEAKPTTDAQTEGMSASVQLLPLPSGLYLFSVKAAPPLNARANGQLSLPAVHVGLGPGIRADQVEFIAGPSSHGAWLFAPGDLLVTRINGSGATLIMTSVRAPGGEVLAIKVERLESRSDAMPASPSAPLVAPSPAPPTAKKAAAKPAARSSSTKSLPASGNGTSADLPPPLQIQVHVRSRGDLSFKDTSWAGRVAPGLWIEAFSVRPLAGLEVQDIEYKGLTASGFETPWLSDDRMCGTRGMAVPLVGFAVRLKASPAASAYDCEYSGYFKSGVTVGPVRNGTPCRSTVANDPLEGVQIRLVKRLRIDLPLVGKPAIPPRPTKTGRPAAKRNGTHKPAAARRKTVSRGTATAAQRPPPALPARHRGARLTRRHPPRRP